MNERNLIAGCDGVLGAVAKGESVAFAERKVLQGRAESAAGRLREAQTVLRQKMRRAELRGDGAAYETLSGKYRHVTYLRASAERIAQSREV